MQASDPSVKQVALGDMEHELTRTRVALERIPEEHLDWKPHRKSWSLGELATHISNLPNWAAFTIEGDGLDMAETGPPNVALESREAVLANFDTSSAAMRQAIRAADDRKLSETWTLRNGGETIFSMPKVAVLRSFVLSHIIHHRAQLTVYLRLLDVPVPSIYGPSADETF